MRHIQIGSYAASTALMVFKVLLLDRKTKQVKYTLSEVTRAASVWLPVRLAGYCQWGGGVSSEILSPASYHIVIQVL